MTSTSQFLEICEPLKKEGINSAYGTLDLNNYIGAMDLSAQALLIEGINQCSVRLGRTIIPGGNEKASRILPVSIKSFTQKRPVEHIKYYIFSSCVPFGNSARVKVTVSDPASRQDIAEAELTVALL